MSVNRVILLGHVGRDPEVNYPQQGHVMARFTLATNEPARVNAAGVQIPERTEWHNIVAVGKNAEIVERYVRKGTRLYIEGKLRTRMWEDRNAIKRYTTEIYIDSFELLGTPRAEQPQQAQPQQPAQ